MHPSIGRYSGPSLSACRWADKPVTGHIVWAPFHYRLTASGGFSGPRTGDYTNTSHSSGHMQGKDGTRSNTGVTVAGDDRPRRALGVFNIRCAREAASPGIESLCERFRLLNSGKDSRPIEGN